MINKYIQKNWKERKVQDNKHSDSQYITQRNKNIEKERLKQLIVEELGLKQSSNILDFAELNQ